MTGDLTQALIESLVDLSGSLVLPESQQAEALVEINQRFQQLPAEDLLAMTSEWFGAGVVFANSFGLEDVVIQHMLLSVAPPQVPPAAFVLDTGRLPGATYELIETWRKRYGTSFQLLTPRQDLLQDFVTQHGPNAFYNGADLRKRCCAIRKMEPLERALQGKKAWINGLRRGQSAAREDVELFSLDATGRLKISPLANWSLAEVWNYVRIHEVPYNDLHDRGYPSIGCAPCTRAIAPGEDIRAGRWWWEQASKRECGLHGHAQRQSEVLVDAR